MKKVTEKKHELEISTLDKMFVGQNFSSHKSEEIIHGCQTFWYIYSWVLNIFFSDKVFSLLLKDCEIYENKEKINEC